MSCDFYELFFFPPQDIIVDYWWLQHLSNWQEAVQTQMEVSQLKGEILPALAKSTCRCKGEGGTGHT